MTYALTHTEYSNTNARDSKSTYKLLYISNLNVKSSKAEILWQFELGTNCYDDITFFVFVGSFVVVVLVYLLTTKVIQECQLIIS